MSTVERVVVYILIILVFNILISSTIMSGKGGLFLFTRAQPANVTRTPEEIPLADISLLNVVTQVKNLYTISGSPPVPVPVEGSLGTIDFKYVVYKGDGSPLGVPFAGEDPDAYGIGNAVKLSPGEYSVSFLSPDKSPYKTDMSPDCRGIIKAKETKKCIVTHTYVGMAKVKVITTVDNTGGGTAKPEETRFAERHCMDAATSAGTSAWSQTGLPHPGKEVSLYPFTVPWTGEPYTYCYSISPEPFPGYVTKADGDCKSDTIKPSETKECTLTYKFVGKGTLNVTTTVDNTGVGTAKPEDFNFGVVNNGERSYFYDYASGDPMGKNVELSAGSYRVTEEGIYVPPGYSHRESGDCWGTISADESKKCQITKTFKVP